MEFVTIDLDVTLVAREGSLEGNAVGLVVDGVAGRDLKLEVIGFQSGVTDHQWVLARFSLKANGLTAQHPGTHDQQRSHDLSVAVGCDGVMNVNEMVEFLQAIEGE